MSNTLRLEEIIKTCKQQNFIEAFRNIENQEQPYESLQKSHKEQKQENNSKKTLNASGSAIVNIIDELLNNHTYIRRNTLSQALKIYLNDALKEKNEPTSNHLKINLDYIYTSTRNDSNTYINARKRKNIQQEMVKDLINLNERKNKPGIKKNEMIIYKEEQGKEDAKKELSKTKNKKTITDYNIPPGTGNTYTFRELIATGTKKGLRPADIINLSTHQLMTRNEKGEWYQKRANKILKLYNENETFKKLIKK